MRRTNLPTWPFLLAVLLFAGCGGGGSRPSSGATGRGGISLTIAWPARAARLVPTSANSLVVTLSREGSTVATRTLHRPLVTETETETTSTADFDGLPYGTLDVTVRAFPTTDGSGVAQAVGGGTLLVAEGVRNVVPVSLVSRAVSLSLSPSMPVLFQGASAMLTATARDEDGNIVLLAASAGGVEPLEWQSDDETRVTVAGSSTSPTAIVKGTGTGSANVTVRLKTDDAGNVLTASTGVTSVALSVVPTAASVTFGSVNSKVVTRPAFPTPPPLPPLTLNVSLNLSPTLGTAPPVALAYTAPLSGPTNATIPANAGATTIAVAYGAVDTDTTATVTATSASGTASGTFTVRPNPLDSASANVSNITGGQSVSGTVKLGMYAYQAESVSLSCTDPSVTIPDSVTVAAPKFGNVGTIQGPRPGYGLSISRSFTIKTPVVTAARTVTIVATRLGVTKSFDLTLTP